MRITVLRPLAGAFSLCALAACSSDDSTSSQQQAGTVVVSATSTTAVAALPQVEDVAAATNSFASFDFANGTRLPEKATLSIGAAVFKPGASVAYVPVTLNRATPNTVIARVITVNGSGTNKAISGYNYKATEDIVIFRPGDPLRQSVSVPILDAANGQQFSLKLREEPWGANQGTASATVTANAGATPTAPATSGFRNARTFRTYGTLQYEMTRSNMRWSDEGWSGAWSTKLSHGRAQVANGETGIYLDGELHPNVEAPLRYTDEGLVFHTQKLDSPISWAGIAYNYGAVVLSGHNTPSTQIGYGQYEWVAKMPDRRGAWPAFWLISTSGWPPEIDVYEGFGYQSYWDFDRHVSSTIHGGSGGWRTFQRGTNIQTEQAYGLSGYSQGYHRYAVDIGPEYITWFVDGLETYQSVNPFRGHRWYPIMNVAVKTGSAYTDGSGDMIVKSFRAWQN
ncbi:family 16 glycosylhydrolase [Sphingomonas sp. DG1-23]|uniref:glycoside hydrolase family 16 protein n=1 Tax=Sphingomonas sp. DG1-23 TaxID=3068316 RepID=UPI00273D0F75|nr:family 16 glycosylhydrolase [Sphingomonas sp. DG1-23]MDP5280574.1 family 16 glycosylhydrolase [Sphingomonas sp. DG1-23]